MNYTRNAQFPMELMENSCLHYINMLILNKKLNLSKNRNEN